MTRFEVFLSLFLSWPEKEKKKQHFCVSNWPLDDRKRLWYIEVTPSGWQQHVSRQRRLLERLRSTIGLRGKVLSWFESYLKGRSQQVSINRTLSKPFDLKCGVPQGSCLGPLLFTIYVSKLFQILKHNLPSVPTFADDSQLYLSFKPSDFSSEVEAVSAMQKYICNVRAWMTEDQLMLNDDKTEFLIIGTRQQLSKVSIQSIKIGQTEVSPVASARNLGTWFDTHLDMGTHITKTCSSAFYYLYN